MTLFFGDPKNKSGENVITQYSNLVLSVAAGATSDIVNATEIHACPDDERYSYRETPFLAVRKTGGYMDFIHKIEAIEIINPRESLVLGHLEEKIRDRVRRYIELRKPVIGFETQGNYKFYVLSAYRKLSHAPAPPRNRPGPCYYTLDDLLCGDKVVQVASKKMQR